MILSNKTLILKNSASLNVKKIIKKKKKSDYAEFVDHLACPLLLIPESYDL